MALTKITSRILDSSGVTILGTIATGVWEGTPIADDHIASAATWNTASTDRLKWDGGATGLTASTGRTSLGLGTVATTAASDYATAAQGTKADTAHGWGNHTGGGYVKTTTDQTIAGVKTFSGEVIINPSANRKISFKDNNNVFKAGIQAVNTAGQMAGTSEVDELIIRSQLGMRFATGGNTERFRITSSGAATFSSSVTSSGLTVNTGNGAGKKIYLNGNTSRRNWMIAAQQNVDDAFEITRSTANGGSTYNSPSFLIQGSTGNVGIGTTSPVKTLDVQGQLAISNSASSYWYLDRNDSSGNFDIINDSNQVKLSISSGGNVTIGTAAAQDFYLALRGGVGGFFGWDDSANKTIVQAPNTRSLSFQVNSDTFGNGTEAMSIESGGATIFGSTSSATSTGASIQHLSNGFLYVKGGSSGASFGDDSQGTRMVAFNDDYLRFDTGGSGEKMRIQSDGDIKITGGGRILSSGGIYLGTNNNVNLLDAYEEGTSTIYFRATGQSPTPTATAYYTRIGNIVYYCFEGTINATANSNAYFDGLPFLPASGYPRSAFYVGWNSATHNSNGGTVYTSGTYAGTGFFWQRNAFALASYWYTGTQYLTVSGSYQV